MYRSVHWQDKTYNRFDISCLRLSCGGALWVKERSALLGSRLGGSATLIEWCGLSSAERHERRGADVPSIKGGRLTDRQQCGMVPRTGGTRAG